MPELLAARYAAGPSHSVHLAFPTVALTARARASLARQIPVYLILAMGTCTEATTTTVDLEDSRGLPLYPAEKVTKYGYIGQNSALCDGVFFFGAVGGWSNFASEF